MPYTSLNWPDAKLEAMWQVADAPADELISQIMAQSGPAEARRIFDLLVRNIHLPFDQMPPSVKTFVDQYAKLPAWTDEALIKKGEAFFMDHGPLMLMMLNFKSLPILYAHARGAKVLTFTGRLAHDPHSDEKFSRRMAETSQFLLDVMAPGGLSPTGQGLETTVRVRLVHASIRAFIRQGQWDFQNDGQPINQVFLAQTLMTFSISLLDGLKDFGIQPTGEEEHAYYHCWRVVAHLLGILPEITPETVASAREYYQTVLEKYTAPSEDGVILTQAILDFFMKKIPLGEFDDAPAITIRYLCGDKYADMLGVKTASGCLGFFLPRFLKLWFGMGERLEDKHPKLDRFAQEFSIVFTCSMLNYFNAYKNQKFRIPLSLLEKWNLKSGPV